MVSVDLNYFLDDLVVYLQLVGFKAYFSEFNSLKATSFAKFNLKKCYELVNFSLN